MKLSDRALANRDDDILDRWGIAKTISDLIANTQTDSALRIGIYGSWGEGKTSVLRFVETLCRKADTPVCWFSVWSAQTQSDLWAALYHELESLSPTPDRWGKIKAGAGKLLTGSEPLTDLHPYSKAAHSLAKLANLKIGDKDVKRIVDHFGTGRRVVILVDDVDRVDSALVPKLLMGLHDLFDELGRCAVVIALDPAVVSGGLSEINPAWSSAPAFLEKIVQYPFRLPRPTQEQMQRLVVEALNESRLNVPRQAVLDVLDLLPPNPRKVKQFIRSLQRLQPTLSRMGEDEWNQTLLLLVDLLRTTSAEAAEELLQDRKFIDEFVMGMVFRRKEDMHKGDKITKEQYARITTAVKTTMPRLPDDERDRMVDQITHIAEEATERLSLVMPDDAIRQIRLDHQPPTITLREFDALAGAWRDSPTEKRLGTLLADHAKAVERSGPEVLEAVAVALLKRRGEAIGEASDSFEIGETQRLVERIESLTSLLERLIVDHKLLEDPRVTSRVSVFLTMRTQTAEFTNRLADGIYAPTRTRLRDQLYRAAPYLRDRAVDVLKDFKPWDRAAAPSDAGAAGGAELKETRERLATIFSEFMCDPLLDRFRRPGGIAALGNFMRSPVELSMLLSSESVFHKPDCRTRLLAIAQEKDDAVAQNFFVYLQMLVGESEGAPRSALASDAGLVVPAWQAAWRVRPQPKMEGSVVELVKRLRAALKDEASIPMPSWIGSLQERAPEPADDVAVGVNPRDEQR
jgi:KAP-like P-loop domain-containing protein